MSLTKTQLPLEHRLPVTTLRLFTKSHRASTAAIRTMTDMTAETVTLRTGGTQQSTCQTLRLLRAGLASPPATPHFPMTTTPWSVSLSGLPQSRPIREQTTMAHPITRPIVLAPTCLTPECRILDCLGAARLPHLLQRTTTTRSVLASVKAALASCLLSLLLRLAWQLP
jgi:hypothetical protein